LHGPIQSARKCASFLLERATMTDQEILDIFSGILRSLLLDDSIFLKMETRREEVPNWDSFNYINFIVAVEMELGVKFKVADVESFENVGEIATQVRAMRP
jgi:acyl carrier protein